MVTKTYLRKAPWMRRGLRKEKFRLADDWQTQWDLLGNCREPFCTIAGAILGWMLGHGGFLTVEDLKYDLPFRFDDFDEMVESMAGLGVIERVA